MKTVGSACARVVTSGVASGHWPQAEVVLRNWAVSTLRGAPFLLRPKLVWGVQIYRSDGEPDAATNGKRTLGPYAVAERQQIGRSGDGLKGERQVRIRPNCGHRKPPQN